MLRTPDIRPRKLLTVAAKAGVQYFPGGKRRERKNCLLSAAVGDMIAARPMAALATRALRRLFTGSDALEMRILVEIAPDDRVARFANIVTYEVIGLLVLRFCDKDAREEYRQKQAGTNWERHYCDLQFREHTHF